MNIVPALESDYLGLIKLWEASVRATHHFLTEADIQYYKLNMPLYLNAVDLYCMYDDQKITGFLGVSNGEIQMLFIHPEVRGKGIGKQLVNFAISKYYVTKVEVNEQNEQAVGFYEHLGFKMIGRTDKDNAGKPFPLLQMALT